MRKGELVDVRYAPGGMEATVAPPVDCYDVLGHRVTVAVAPHEARIAVRSILRGFGPIAATQDESAARYSLVAEAGQGWETRADDGILWSGEHFLTALAMLEWQIVTDALNYRTDLFHLHGAALVAPGGRNGLLIVGDSGRGKTTLTLGLLAHGFAPFGDDVALVTTETLALQPVRRAFHLEKGTKELLSSLGALYEWDFEDAPQGYFVPPRWAEGTATVRVALFPELQPGEAPRLVSLTPAEAAAALLAQTVSLARAPRAALATVARLTERAACYRLIAGDLTATVALVRDLLTTGAVLVEQSPESVNHYGK